MLLMEMAHGTELFVSNCRTDITLHYTMSVQVNGKQYLSDRAIRLLISTHLIIEHHRLQKQTQMRCLIYIGRYFCEHTFRYKFIQNHYFVKWRYFSYTRMQRQCCQQQGRRTQKTFVKCSTFACNYSWNRQIYFFSSKNVPVSRGSNKPNPKHSA